MLLTSFSYIIMLFQSLKLRRAVVTNDFSNDALVTQSKNFRRMRNINNTEKIIGLHRFD
jgi:hypothetical protein